VNSQGRADLADDFGLTTSVAAHLLKLLEQLLDLIVIFGEQLNSVLLLFFGSGS
jgi:hypothetical protein